MKQRSNPKKELKELFNMINIYQSKGIDTSKLIRKRDIYWSRLRAIKYDKLKDCGYMVGNKVYHDKFGEGIIESYDLTYRCEFPINVNFKNELVTKQFNLDGKYLVTDKIKLQVL